MFGTVPSRRTRQFVNPRQTMGYVFNQPIAGVPYQTVWQRGSNGTTQRPYVFPLPIDVYATADEVVIEAAAPGLHPENLDITFHDGAVVLSGTYGNPAASDQNGETTWYVHELWSGSFRRVVHLPFEVDADNAQATWEHGMLRLTLPKAERARPKKIALQIGGRTEAIEANGSSSRKSKSSE